MSQLASDLINSALRLINVIASGETPDASESADALVVLQQMIDSWNAERLAIYVVASNDFPFVVGQQAYTLGTGGNFNMGRPARITGMSSILLNNPSNPIEVPIAIWTVQQWQTQLPVKSVNGSFPLICYDDGAYPLRNLNFWPIPQQANNVRIYSWQALTAPVNLSDTLDFPPGYAEAFRYNLAVRLAPEFAAQLPPTVQQLAIDSMARIRTMNAPDLQMTSDLVASPAGYNWKADMFGIPY